jgi:hypothetical protein
MDTPNSAPPRPAGISLALALVTIVAGLSIRFAPLGLPLFMKKYGGSGLWALMIYWVVSTLLPSWRPRNLILLAGGLATAVEVFKLYRAPGMDAFRTTLPGILLLGRVFSVWDILVYWVFIGLGAALDQRLREHRFS